MLVSAVRDYSKHYAGPACPVVQCFRISIVRTIKGIDKEQKQRQKQKQEQKQGKKRPGLCRGVQVALVTGDSKVLCRHSLALL